MPSDFNGSSDSSENEVVPLRRAGGVSRLVRPTDRLTPAVGRRLLLPPDSPFCLRLGDFLFVRIGRGTKVLATAEFHQGFVSSCANFFLLIAEQVDEFAAQAR